MDLNTKGRYAVMAMVDLAQHGASGSVPLTDIADRQQISLAYLEQIFQKLRRAGVVESVRGRLGGYRLARGMDAIFVGEIMAAVEEPVDMTRCHRQSAQGCVAGDRCKTHFLWDALSTHIEDFLDRVSLSDIVEGRLAVRREPKATVGAAAE